MYIHLGSGVTVRDREIVGIFDLDNTTVRKNTRDTLETAQKYGKVINVSPLDLPKSFVLTSSGKGDEKFYISPISVQTILKRTNPKNGIGDNFRL